MKKALCLTLCLIFTLALLLAALTFDYIRKERREKELIAASKRNA